MQDTILEIINSYGYMGICFLIMIENIFPPIPSEIILLFGGFMTTYTYMTPTMVIIFSTLGSILGAIFLYLVGFILNAERLEKLIDSPIGKMLFLKKGDIKKAESWFLKHGNMAVFFCRFVPVVRSLISIPAGSAKMNLFPFIVYTTIGSVIWNTILIHLGRIAGNNWEHILVYFKIYSKIAILIFILFSLVLGIFYYKKKNK